MAGIFGIPVNTVVILGAIGYLWYAHKNKLPPFNKKEDIAAPPPPPMDITPVPKPNELPGSPPDNVSGNPFTGGMPDIDMGMGNRMPDPTPMGTISPAERAKMPFGSSVQSDPTPTDYGIYTQYMQGLRNEYQKMDNDRRTAAAGDIGIGGDITTLPQPPTVGATPFNFPGPGMVGMGPPPPPTWAAFPPPWSQMPPMPPGYFPIPDIYIPYIPEPIRVPRTGIQVGPIHIGPDGIRIGNQIIVQPGFIKVGDSIRLNGNNIQVGNKIILDKSGGSSSNINFNNLPGTNFGGNDIGDINDYIKNMFGNFGGMFSSNFTNTTFIERDEMPTVASDISTINPTLFNMVSRNQPAGMMYDKLGNY